MFCHKEENIKSEFCHSLVFNLKRVYTTARIVQTRQNIGPDLISFLRKQSTFHGAI